MTRRNDPEALKQEKKLLVEPDTRRQVAHPDVPPRVRRRQAAVAAKQAFEKLDLEVLRALENCRGNLLFRGPGAATKDVFQEAAEHTRRSDHRRSRLPLLDT